MARARGGHRRRQLGHPHAAASGPARPSILARPAPGGRARPAPADGRAVRGRPSKLEPFTLDAPGDPSQAAFWAVAGCIVPGSDLVLEDVYAGPARLGFVDVLRRMGAEIDVEPHDARSADIHARYSPGL